MNDAMLYLMDVQFRGLILILVALGLSWIVRKRSPYFETVIWRGMFVGLAAIPLLAWLIPAVAISLPREMVMHRDAPRLSLKSPSEPFSVSYPENETPLIPERGEALRHRTKLQAEPNPAASGFQSTDVLAVKSVVEHQIRAEASEGKSFSHFQWAGILWLTGAVLMLLRFAAAFATRRRLCQASTLIKQGQCLAEANELCRQLHIEAGAILRTHPQVKSPLSWGWRRPVIILPAEFERWTSRTLRLVLQHELNHFAHRDAWFRMIAELTLIFYWPNPLVWTTLHRFRLAEELVTDAAVLDHGEPADQYAELLLNFARGDVGIGAQTERVTFSMAQHSTIGARLEAMLQGSRHSSRPGRRSRLGWSLVIGLMALTTGGLSFRATSAQSSQSSEPAKDMSLLETRVYAVKPTYFQRNSDLKASGPSLEDLLWKEREKQPPHGASAVYNSRNSTLIIRTTRAEFLELESGPFVLWRQEGTMQTDVHRDVEVTYIEMNKKEAQQFQREFGDAIDASQAWKRIREMATRDSSNLRLLGTALAEPHSAGHRSRTESVSGLIFETNVVLRPTKEPQVFNSQLILQTSGGLSPLRTSVDLRPGAPRLAGLIELSEGEKSIAAFVTLRLY